MKLSGRVQDVVCVASVISLLVCYGSGIVVYAKTLELEKECNVVLNARTGSWCGIAENCSIVADRTSDRFLTSQTKGVKEDSINICSEKFSSTAIRLNSEIYNETADVVNIEHIKRDYGPSGTRLYESYLAHVDAVMPLALTTCETYGWADSRYTWCSAVYSDLLAKKGTNMQKCKIAQVNTDTYVVAGLCTYMGCGKNCTAVEGSHHHTIGNNDNDSLGPLQILRRYVESDGYIKYPCGETTVDLMCWHDNVEYFLHRQSESFADKAFWNSSHEIQSENELMALIAVAHNTGSGFMHSASAGSLWHDSQSVFKFCEKLGSKESYAVLSSYVDEWYESLENTDTEQFLLAGNYYGSKYSTILKDLGINKTAYASSFGHKQYYPLKAVLNYMSLNKLYHSGEEQAEEADS